MCLPTPSTTSADVPQCRAQKSIKVSCRSSEALTSRGEVEAGEEALRIICAWLRYLLSSLWLYTEKILFNELDSAFEICKTGRFGTVMG